MNDTLLKLKSSFPMLKFVPGKNFCWSPEQGEIIYNELADGETASWSLLHESGHALLGHTNYRADFELLCLEVAAWDKAHALGKALNIFISEDHVQDCLDTYREWLYKRSICPKCTAKCLQQGDFIHYRCYNCHKIWKVSSNRFGRSYRSTKNIDQPAVFLKSINN